VYFNNSDNLDGESAADSGDYGPSYVFGVLNAGSFFGYLRHRLSFRGKRADIGENKPRTNSMRTDKKEREYFNKENDLANKSQINEAKDELFTVKSNKVISSRLHKSLFKSSNIDDSQFDTSLFDEFEDSSDSQLRNVK
jgi:hypothetical protein